MGGEKYMKEPKLRFKADDGSDFPELEAKSLFDICEYKNKQSVGKNYVGTENMKQNFSGLESLDEETEMKGVCYCKGDTLMSNIRPYLRKTWKADREGVCSTDVLVFHPIDVVSEYLHYLIASDKFISYVMTGVKGVKMPRGDKEHMMKFSIMVPSLPEQQKIADFLSTIDTIIEKQQATVSAWEERKKGVIQKLFSQEVRFKADDGSDFPDWEEKKFGDVIKEFKEKTKIEDEDILLSCAIDGVYLNSELFGHQRGQSNIGYLKVKRGTLILSAQNLHLGNANVNMRFEHGIISPAYKTYEIVGCTIEYMNQWVKWDMTKQFFYNATTVGASGCRRNVDWLMLYNQMFILPSLPEQQKIADCLSALDTVIQKQKETLEKWQELKKGLLQQMFV